MISRNRAYNVTSVARDRPGTLVLGQIGLAILELGLPVAVLAWWLFYRLYSRGELARNADRKALRRGLREIRKATKKSAGAEVGILQKKWMKFGGGFYGVAALWTLIVMEVTGAVSTAMNPSVLLASLDKGVFSFVVDFLVNQFLTFVAALIWFTYWNSHSDAFFTWILAAYGGYLVGLRGRPDRRYRNRHRCDAGVVFDSSGA